eukprot:3376945-Pyramimonas_sp.AAC.1
MAAVKRRGGWETYRSFQRYEKHAWMSRSWERLSENFKAHTKLCEARLEGAPLDGQAVPVFP